MVRRGRRVLVAAQLHHRRRLQRRCLSAWPAVNEAYDTASGQPARRSSTIFRRTAPLRESADGGERRGAARRSRAR